MEDLFAIAAMLACFGFAFVFERLFERLIRMRNHES